MNLSSSVVFVDSLFVENIVVIVIIFLNVNGIGVLGLTKQSIGLLQIKIRMTLVMDHSVFFFVVNNQKDLLLTQGTELNGFLKESSLSFLEGYI